MKRTTIQPPMLPGMGRPEFGGVQLRPGMESRRAYTGPHQGLFDEPTTATQDAMLEDAGEDTTMNHLIVEPMYRIPAYRIQLVRDSGPTCNRAAISSPRSAVDIIRGYIGDPDTEHMVALLLDTKNQPVGIHTVSIGQLDFAMVRVADVFKAAILANARSMILGHNHPSGNPHPSPDDVAITRKLVEAGKLMQLEILDHVILGEGDRYLSLKEEGLLTD